MTMTATINAPTPMPLLNIASCLCELTTSPNDLCHIPHYLLALLPLSHVSFAIVRQLDGNRSELVVSASASSDQCPLPPEAFRAAALNRALRDAGLSESSWQQPGNAPTPSADDTHNFNAHATAPLTTITQLNATHRMVLIAYLNGDPGHPASDLHGTLDGARSFLARPPRCPKPPAPRRA